VAIRKQLARGFLLVIEGIDGAGKSTQARRLHEQLSGEGFDSLTLFEPTDGPYGRRIRELAVSGREGIGADEELDLFLKDREQNVRDNIGPALDANRIVILDRYYFSTIAYQGARGLDPERLREMNEKIAPVPDLLLYIQIPLEIVEQRIKRGRGDSPNLFEELDYLAKVKALFDQMDFPYLHTVDGTQSEDAVFADLFQIARSYIDRHIE
jgi:dTMP kinase